MRLIRTAKAPTKKGILHSQVAHTRQELAEPGRSSTLASYPQSRTRLILVSL